MAPRAVAPLAAALALLAAGRAGAAGFAIGSVTVEPRTSSAAISWRSSEPAQAVVELGLSEDYGIWSNVVTGTAARVVAGGLEPSTTYRFRVVARTGSRRAESKGSFTTRPIGDGTGATTTPNALLVDGQPFFPRMVWKECPSGFPSSLGAGINLFMGGCGSARAQLDALTGRAYAVTDAAERGFSGRGLVGWHQPDEADEHGGADGLAALPPSRQSGRVSFLTLTNHFYSGAAPLPQGRGMYPALIARAEMIGFDLYPLAIWCRRAFLSVYDAQRELEALAPGKPTYQWIEAAPMTGCNRFIPTPDSVEAETWLAIAGGARGIGYFPGDWQPDIAQAIAGVNRQIAALAPALLGPERPVQSSLNAVRVGGRSYAGATYVIAVNGSVRLSALVRFTVPGLAARTVRVYGEGRMLPVRGGVFVDRLPPLAARVYVAPPPNAP